MWKNTKTQRIYYDKTHNYYKATTLTPYKRETRCFKTFEEAVCYFSQKNETLPSPLSQFLPSYGPSEGGVVPEWRFLLS